MSRMDDRLERDLGHIADKATPSPTAFEAIQARIASQGPEQETEIIVLQPDPKKTRRISVRVMGAAAAVAVAVVGVTVVLLRSDDSTSVRVADSTTTAAPSPTTAVSTTLAPVTSVAPTTALVELSLVPVAEAFIEARAAFDGEAVRSIVADDATISPDSEWVSSPDEYLLLDDWERATGMTFLDVDCRDGSPGRVRCTYSMETTMSRALDLGPYDDNSFVFEITDGLIQQVNHTRNVAEAGLGERYYSDVYFIHFKPWVEANHPGDDAVMFNTGDDGVFNSDAPFINSESIALWETYVEDFVDSLEQSASE